MQNYNKAPNINFFQRFQKMLMIPIFLTYIPNSGVLGSIKIEVFRAKQLFFRISENESQVEIFAFFSNLSLPTDIDTEFWSSLFSNFFLWYYHIFTQHWVKLASEIKKMWKLELFCICLYFIWNIKYLIFSEILKTVFWFLKHLQFSMFVRNEVIINSFFENFEKGWISACVHVFFSFFKL